MGNVYSVDSLDKGTIHVLGRTEWDDTGIHTTTQKSMQFKLMNCFFLEFSI